MDDILEWEAEHGNVVDDSFVFVNTGWRTEHGERSLGFHPEAVQWLRRNR